MKAVGRIPASLVVWAASFAFFLFTLAANFSASHDSIHYLNGIIEGVDLFHQHHLLYHISAYYWLKLTQPLFPGIRDYYLIESFTAIWGSGSLALIYSFFRNRFKLSTITSIVGASIIGFSYGMWFYSVNIETYAPPIFFILAALYILSGDHFSLKDVWKASLLHCLAILFHQINILFVIVILFVLIKKRRHINIRRSLTQYIVMGILLVGGMYFLAGWVIEGHNSISGWVRWMEGYAVGHGYWQPLSSKTPLHVLAGLSRAFIGGHYLFQLPFIKDYFVQSFYLHGLNDEIYLSSHISASLALILAIFTLILALLGILLTVRFIRRYRAITKSAAIVVHPILICIAVYSAFFFFWMPEILEFWILQMTLIWILLIGMTPITRFPLRIPVIPGLMVISILIFVINFFGSLRWLHDIRNDWYYTQADKVIQATEKGDMILTENGWILKDFLKYYSNAVVLSPDDPGYGPSQADSAVETALANRHKIYIYRQPNLQDSAITTYLNGLLQRYEQRKKIFSGSNPLIYVLE